MKNIPVVTNDALLVCEITKVSMCAPKHVGPESIDLWGVVAAMSVAENCRLKPSSVVQ